MQFGDIVPTPNWCGGTDHWCWRSVCWCGGTLVRNKIHLIPKQLTPRQLNPKKLIPKKLNPKKTLPQKTQPQRQLIPKDNSTPKKSSPKNSTPKTTQPEKSHPRVEIFGVEFFLGGWLFLDWYVFGDELSLFLGTWGRRSVLESHLALNFSWDCENQKKYFSLRRVHKPCKFIQKDSEAYRIFYKLWGVRKNV